MQTPTARGFGCRFVAAAECSSRKGLGLAGSMPSSGRETTICGTDTKGLIFADWGGVPSGVAAERRADGGWEEGGEPVDRSTAEVTALLEGGSDAALVSADGLFETLSL